jgi:two-component system sensor kinase FixL
MSWLTILWSMLTSVCLTFTLLHLFVWAKGIKPKANLAFAVAAGTGAVISGMEMTAMQSTSIEQIAMIMRWVHLPVLFLWLAIFYFVRCYFEAGSLWLAWTGGSLRALALLLSFTTGQSLFFNEITHLKRIELIGGETISIAQGSLNPWYVVGPLSTFVLAVFVWHAAYTLWRSGTDTGRRRAILFSGSITFFLIIAPIHTALVNAGLIDSPYLVGFSFLPILLAMSYELSYDMLHAAQIANQLRLREAEAYINKQRMKLAVSAADLRLWEWDMVRDQIWSSDKNRTLYGFAEPREISFDNLLDIVCKEDREQVRLAVEKSINGNGNYENEYRIQMPDGRIRWFHSRGRVDFDNRHRPLRMLGVTIDITRRKQAELEAQQQRNELAHLSRVNLLGELSGSLAHELNQPLTAILSNAQAAQRFLMRDRPDLAEVRNILDDIVAEEKRAGDIIQRLRLLLKKGEIQRLALDLNKVIYEVLKLLHSDLVNHGVAVNLDLDRTLPPVMGDRIQLQQVLLNLIMNTCEAISRQNEKNCKLVIRTEQIENNRARIAVVDQGSGIPDELIDSIFEPFFTTKTHGMGLGLTICRTIITAHGGRLWAVNNNHAGATFYFTLPLCHQEAA